MRLFVAIFLPETVLSSLESLSRRLGSPRLRWTPTASLHITLRFIGETEPVNVARLEAALLKAASSDAPFELEVAGGGVFPDARRPRVFWAGLGGDVARLSALAGRASAAVAGIGLPPEDRPFAPHLTLARCRADVRCQPDDARLFIEAASELRVPRFPVRSIHLVRSHLGATGPRYETLESYPLAA